MKILQTLSILWETKVAWKHYRDLFNLRWKKHDCYWAWFKGRDNQDKLATWHKIFQRSPSSRLEFCKAKSSLDGCDSMLHDDWLHIPWVTILHSFCFKPRMVSDKNTRGNIFTIMFLCSLHKGIIAKSESSCYLPKVLALGQKLVLGKPSNCTQVGEVVSPPTSTFVYLSQDLHNEICNIYDKYMHLQPLFQSLYEQGE